MSSLFSLRVERPLIVTLLMNLELRLVGAMPFTVKQIISNCYPTKLFKDRCNMVEFSGSGHYAGSKVLNSLSLVDVSNRSI